MSIYTIKKGNHNASGLHFGVHFGITEQKYKVRFSKECLYEPLDWENDWNKLCGWSYGMHHTNSIRVCWRPCTFIHYSSSDEKLVAPTQIELCIYVYENGVRHISKLTVIVNVQEDIDIELKYVKETLPVVWSGINLRVSGHIGNICLEYNAKPTLGYRLYPYFGGDKPSPQDLIIELDRI